MDVSMVNHMVKLMNYASKAVDVYVTENAEVRMKDDVVLEKIKIVLETADVLNAVINDPATSYGKFWKGEERYNRQDYYKAFGPHLSSILIAPDFVGVTGERDAGFFNLRKAKLANEKVAIPYSPEEVESAVKRLYRWANKNVGSTDTKSMNMSVAIASAAIEINGRCNSTARVPVSVIDGIGDGEIFSHTLDSAMKALLVEAFTLR